MKALILLLVASVLAVAAHAAPLKVVVTIPDLADLTRKVGGDQVDVFAMASGREDPHNVPMRPSAITRLQQADLFIIIGLDLEHSYAPALLAESRNQRIQRGQPGFLDLSGGVRPLEVPTNVDRSLGELHANGNPHYNTDPVYGQMMVRVIADKLAQLAPAGAAQFKANAAAYNQQLGAKIAQWRGKLGKGTKFVSYHPDLIYFAARFGLQQVGTIQAKPGIEPGPRYIDELAARMQSEGVKLIAKESFYSDRLPNELAKRTGARVVSVPIMVNGTKDASDYISMIDALVNAFASALMVEALLQLREATLGYGSDAVLERLDLAVATGDFIVIGGPNGGGKTTLLRSFAGLIPLLGGKREIGTVRFGYVPQQAAVEQALPITARELVEAGAAAALPWWRAIFGARKAEVRKCLCACRADQFAAKPFAELSGGQRQRVLLARALALDPTCLLLDEPTAGVDRATQTALAELLAELNRERGLTVLLVTHEFVPFLKVATRLLWVHDGRCETVSPEHFAARQESW